MAGEKFALNRSEKLNDYFLTITRFGTIEREIELKDKWNTNIWLSLLLR